MIAVVIYFELFKKVLNLNKSNNNYITNFSFETIDNLKIL